MRKPERKHIKPPTVQTKQVNWLEMAKRLEDRIEHRIEQEAVIPGTKKPVYKSKWPGIAKNLASPVKNTLTNKSYMIHPLKLGDAIVSSKKAGFRKFRRDKKNYKRANQLDEKYTPLAEKIISDFRAEAQNALNTLAEEIRRDQSGQNTRFYLDKYQQAVQKAEIRFQEREAELISNYMKEFKGKKKK